MIDFGLAKTYIDSATGEHIPMKNGMKMVGTCQYLSPNSHKCYELSRRDDLISLGYVIIKLIKGVLPWQNVRSLDIWESSKKTFILKKQTTNEKICESCPKQFVTYMNYVMNL